MHKPAAVGEPQTGPIRIFSNFHHRFWLEKTKLAASSFDDWKQRQFADTWNGDVWKVILHLQSLRDDVNAFVLDCDHGLGVITWGKPEKKMHYTKEQITALTYEDFNKNRKDFINLKSPSYLYEYFGIRQ